MYSFPAVLAVLTPFLALAAPAERATAPHTLEQYRSRRAELGKLVSDGVTVLFGRRGEQEDLRTGFFQEPNFYYLTGWKEPGAILLLAPLPEDQTAPGYAAKAALPREILFLPERNPDEEKWTGRKRGADDENIQALTGFAVVMPAMRFEAELRRVLEIYSRIYTVTDQPAAEQLGKIAPLRRISNAAQDLARLRMRKSPEEIALLERSANATIDAHRTAWRRADAGMYEYQVAAAMVQTFEDKGCERPAYAPIVGSGPNSVFLHYSQNSRRLESGDVLLMDVGAECAGYVSDITRTIPVNGKFSKRQRELYEIVLGAQKAAIAEVKPGMTLSKTAANTLYKVAYDYLNSHGRDLHGERLGKYFTHGIGHHVGLEVHDASDPSTPLEPGMVITIEPGLYIPEENIGIRIEDIVLVTEHGAKVLSSSLPREPGEIEKLVARSTSSGASN